MASRPVTSTIWVGNLPFDITESELGQLLGTAGPVKNLRLIIDRDTGKGKGFGFAEFYDKATAESAFRNLNNSELHGRNIRIDFAEDNYKNFRDRDDRPPAGDRRDSGRDAGGRTIGYTAAAQSAQQVAGMLGGAAASDRRTQDQLNELLASKRAPELWEVLRLLRDQFGGDRQAAVNWFAERPGVAKAVFQAQVLLGMVKPPPAGAAPAAAPAGSYVQPNPPANFQEGPIGLGGRMAGSGVPPPPPSTGPGAPPPPPSGPRPMAPAVGGPMGLPPVVPPPPGPGMQGPGMQVVMVDPTTGQQQYMQMPQQQLGGPGMPMQQPQGMMQLPPQQQMHMTPQHQLQMQPIGQDQLVMQPIQQQPPPPPQPMMMQPQPPPSGGVAGALAGQDPQQTQALLRQVMTMSDEQINSLPENFRQQVLFVKEQIRIGAVKLE